MNQFTKYIILVFIFSVSLTVSGQSFNVVKSIKKKIKDVFTIDNRTAEEKTLNDSLELAKTRYLNLIFTSDIDSLKILEQDYAKYVYQENNELNKAKYLFYRGYKHHIREEVDSAIYYYEKSLHLIPESYPGTYVHKYRIIALCHLASIYHHILYDPVQAMIYLEDALDRCDEYFYPGYRLEAKSIVASIYSYTDNHKEAIQIAEQALSFNEYNRAWGLGGDDYLSFILIEELANLYLLCESCNKQEKAFDLLNSVLDYYQKENDYSQMSTLSTLAVTQNNSFSEKQINEYMQRALSLAEENALPPVARDIKLNYGIYLTNIGCINESIFILDSLEKIVDTSNLLFHKNVNNALNTAYIITDDEEKAFITKSNSNSYQERIKSRYSTPKILKLLEIHKVNDSDHLVTLLERRSEIVYSLGTLAIALFGISIFLLGLTFYSRRKIRVQNIELQLANKAKNELFLILSHDLKGPISSFDNLSKRVSYLLEKEDYAGLKKFAKYFSTSGESLKHTVTSLLDWSLSQKDNFILEPETIYVYQTINTIIKELEYLIIDKKIIIEVIVKKEHKVICDKNSFLIIYRNLINNALKNSDIGSNVKIYTESSKMLNVYIENYVSDMSKSQIEKIKSAIGVTHEGIYLRMRTSGIGLHTVSNLLRHNNGKISSDMDGNILSVKTSLPM